MTGCLYSEETSASSLAHDVKENTFDGLRHSLLQFHLGLYFICVE